MGFEFVDEKPNAAGKNVNDYDDDFVIEDDLDANAVYEVNIKVFGVGGGGCNALEYMAKEGVDGVEYVAINTDVKALREKDSKLMSRVQIGKKCTKGQGAGGRPEVASEAAKESRDAIEEKLKGTQMVFISAGMGGGTGTGAAPVVAEIAKEMGILTVGVVTKPFDFEREHKMNLALKGIAEMRKHVDALLIIPNQRLLGLNEKAINFMKAFEMVDDVLYRSVRTVSDLVHKTTLMNVDYSDVKTILENAGDAHIAIGEAAGENKVSEAVQQIINSPLLETSIHSAGKLLVSVNMSNDMLLQDYDEAMRKITEAAHPDVQVITGADYVQDLKDTIQITVIATCFAEQKEKPEEKTQAKEDEVVKNDNNITTTTSDSLGDIITRSLEGTDNDDNYTLLQNFFKKK